jgi:Tol biopolymer transport system component
MPLGTNAGDATLVLWPTTRAGATGPDRVLINERDTSIWQGRISPNGRWLAFVALRPSRPGHVELVITPFDAPSPDRWVHVAPDHEWPDKPRWAPDGRTLYFISRHPGAYFNLWGVRVDPNTGKLVGEPFAIKKIVSPALIISPDMANAEIGVASRQLVLTMQSTTGNIWMLEGVDR